MSSCFPVLCCTFFSFQRSARTARPILTLYGSNDVVQPKDGSFGVKMMSDITWGNVPQKPNKKGFNRTGIFKQHLPKSINCNISQTIHRISPKFDDETHTINGTLSVVHHYVKKCNVADVRHLENWYNVIARPPTVRVTRICANAKWDDDNYW